MYKSLTSTTGQNKYQKFRIWKINLNQKMKQKEIMQKKI